MLIATVFMSCHPRPLPSVTKWPWTLLPTLPGHDDWNARLQQFVQAPIRFSSSIQFKPGLLPGTFDVFYFSLRDSSPGQVKTFPHPPRAQQPCCVQRFGGCALTVLIMPLLTLAKLLLLCLCWFVGGLLRCHPSKLRATNLTCSSAEAENTLKSM